MTRNFYRNKKHNLRKYFINNTVKNKEQFPHFRQYFKSKHPALIVGEQFDKVKKIEEWKYRKVMHGEKDGRHHNETIIPNPDPTDSEPMNIARRVRHDSKQNFSSWKYPWKYPKKQ